MNYVCTRWPERRLSIWNCGPSSLFIFTIYCFLTLRYLEKRWTGNEKCSRLSPLHSGTHQWNNRTQLSLYKPCFADGANGFDQSNGNRSRCSVEGLVIGRSSGLETLQENAIDLLCCSDNLLNSGLGHACLEHPYGTFTLIFR